MPKKLKSASLNGIVTLLLSSTNSVIVFNCVMQGWANFLHKGPHLKNFEAKGRTDWKSKKGQHVLWCLISTKNQ